MTRTRARRGTPQARTAAFHVAVFAVVVLFVELAVRPPTAIVATGVVFGLVHALMAAGLILVYRTTRVVNFAQAAIGAGGAELTFQLLQLTETPFVVCLLLGLAVAALLGLLFDLVLGRRFFRSPRLVLTVATIASATLLGAVGASLVGMLPFLPRGGAVIGPDAVGIREYLPFAGLSFTIGDYAIPFGFPEIFAVEVALLGLGLLALFLRYTKSGVAVRAMAENTEQAGRLGISVGSLSSIVWTLAGLLSGAAIIALGGLTTPGVARGVAPTVLLPPLAAAVLARMQSLPRALFASLGIAVLTHAFTFRYRGDAALVDVGLLVVIAVSLIVQRRTLGRSEVGAGVSWEAAEEQRPIPKELLGVGGVRLARYAAIALGLTIVLAFPFLVSTRNIALGAIVALNAVVALSIVILTGWAGQVSLGQFAFVAIGAVVGGAMTSSVGLPFWFAVPLSAVVTGAFAVLVGLPALRIKGLFLAVVTFAFAVAVSRVLFQERYFGWLLVDDIKRPTLFFLDFDDERSMYYLCVLTLVVSIAAVLNLRRSRLGRILIAVRENEPNLASAGIDAVRTKLTAFALSGALAGMAGAIYAHHQRGVSAESFEAAKSIDLFLLAVVGGVTSVGGALIGSAYYNITTYFFSGNLVFDFFRPFAVLILLYVAPGGLISIVNSARDGVLRIVAQRRQIVVPSLFADYDPEVLHHRLIPLAEPSDTAGMAIMGPGPRYRLASELHGLPRAGKAVRPTNGSRPGGDVSAAEPVVPGAVHAAGELARVEVTG